MNSEDKKMNVEGVAKDVALNTTGSTVAMIVTQPVSFPLMRVISLRYVKPDKSYVALVYEIIKAGGVYNGISTNSVRRAGLICAPTGMIQTLQTQYDLNAKETLAIATMLSCTVTFALGEMREKHRLSGGTNIIQYRSNIPWIAGSTVGREILFNSAMFNSKLLVDYLVEQYGESISEVTGTKEKNVGKVVEIPVKAVLIVMTTPCDRLSTKFANGDSTPSQIWKEVFSNPRQLFSGAILRTAFGVIATSAIPKGMEYAHKLSKACEGLTSSDTKNLSNNLVSNFAPNFSEHQNFNDAINPNEGQTSSVGRE